MPRADLVALVNHYSSEVKRGRPPFSREIMLSLQFPRQCFPLSDPAMEEALHELPVFRECAGLEAWDEGLPDESTFLRFRLVLEKHKLAAQVLLTVNGVLTAKGMMLMSGTVTNATLVAAPSSTKNKSGTLRPADDAKLQRSAVAS